MVPEDLGVVQARLGWNSGSEEAGDGEMAGVEVVIAGVEVGAEAVVGVAVGSGTAAGVAAKEVTGVGGGTAICCS